jgi:hypothetical protein
MALAVCAPVLGAATARAATTNILTVQYGKPGWIPITGDWNATGKDQIGAYDPSTATFYEADDSGQTIRTVRLGQPGWLPVVGDWDGHGTELGAFDQSTSTFYLDEQAGTVAIHYGTAGDEPAVGDFDAGPTTLLGVWRPSARSFYLSTRGSSAVTTIPFGDAGDIPITGNWAGSSGPTGIGVYRPSNSTFYLGSADNRDPPAAITFGSAGDTPIIGDWDGLRKDEIGTYDPSTATFTLLGSFPAAAAPPPTTTPAPVKPVQRAPVSVSLPVPRAPGSVHTKVSFRWTWAPRRTTLDRFVLGRLPRHAKVTVRCRGAGCPLHRLVVHPARRARTIARLDGTRYRPGDRITVVVSARGRHAERGTERIRSGRRPVVVGR